MATRVSTDKILNMLSEKTIEHHRLLKRNIDQRRNGMEDLYGQPFIEYGDASNPATFYISISPDYIYLERYAFKFVIKPYQTTVTGGTDSATVTVNNRNLQIQGSGSSAEINPNPHNHTTQPHTHNLVTGKSFVPTVSDQWTVTIADVDITDYLKEQQGGRWISGEGIYPNRRLDDLVDFYDILDVASVLDAMGTKKSLEERDALLKPELKKVEIASDAPFGVQAYLYLKYSHVNR